MDIQRQTDTYVASHPEPKRGDLQVLHDMIIDAQPGCTRWFLDGKNEDGKIVSNPNIGYGTRTINYANGETREFYRIGLSANGTGISIYILGLDDKTHLARTYGTTIGKAKVTGYCIRFKKLDDINIDTLRAAILDGLS